MKKVSVSIREEQYEALTEREESGEASSFSEALRQVLDEYEAVRTECEELRTECETLQNERNDLQRQLREANRRNDEVTELVEFVDEERSLQERREERRSAPLWTRARWWVFGEPTDEDG
jgi:predicted  nucleic acid-binding Zn-ribbon protein